MRDSRQKGITCMRKDYTNVRYGFLVAIRPLEATSKNRAVLWLFRCDCGKEKIAEPSQVSANRIKSCGCKTKELRIGNRRLPSGEAAFRQLFRSYKNGAKNRGYHFELSMDDFRKLTKQNCYYCGDIPSLVYSIKANNTKEYVYNGVDRVDNTKGYIKGNVVPCCGMCNKLKSDFNLSGFLSKIERIYKKHSSTASLLGSEI